MCRNRVCSPTVIFNRIIFFSTSRDTCLPLYTGKNLTYTCVHTNITDELNRSLNCFSWESLMAKLMVTMSVKLKKLFGGVLL